MLPKINKASRIISKLVTTGGSKYGSVYANFPEVLRTKTDFDSLNLTERDVGQLFKLFKGCDMGKHEVKITKLLAYLKVGKSNFAEKLFSYYDIPKTGNIDFHQFVLVLWNFCTLDKSLLEYFVFDLYDRFREGEIEGGEVRIIIRDLYGENYTRNQGARKAYFSLEEIESQMITSANFVTLCSIHESLLFPASFMQQKLRDDFLSIDYWYESYELRFAVCRGKYMPMDTVMRRLHRRLKDTLYDQSVAESSQHSLQKSDSVMTENADDASVSTKQTRRALSPRSRAKKSKRVAKQDAANNPHLYLSKMSKTKKTTKKYRSPYLLPSDIKLPNISRPKEAINPNQQLKVGAPSKKMMKRRRAQNRAM